MLAAIRNATNVKVVFRLKDPKEAEDLAHMVVPLDLEIPVETLTRPTVVGHRRIHLQSESASASRSRSAGRSVSAGETEAVGETVAQSSGYGSSEGVSAGRSTGESASEGVTAGASFGESAAHSTSTMAATTTGASFSMGVVTTPTEETVFLPPEEPTVLSENYGIGGSVSESLGVGASATHGRSSAVSEAKSRMNGRSSAASATQSRSVSQSSSFSHAHSVAQARSRARSTSESESQGESETKGLSEALEPILENRPSSVHSRDNVLYMAAQTLRNLPTGHAFLNYVGANGMVATRLVVPPIKDCAMTNAAFVALRERLLAESAAAIPAALARALVDERERSFRSFTALGMAHIQEPESFRVAARIDAPCRALAGPVAARRALSGPSAADTVLIDAAPLTDGGQG
ncbi:MAG: hypothetical protein FJX06_20950, partial [Alphaproteobacteria bacterium]|nr:hypothetical protein [Alphaproteobacteria bacterium]